jgi:hypothetical protein
MICLDENIQKLDIENNVIETLNSNEIFKIKDLWPLTREELKEMGFSDQGVKNIVVHLQLKGMDLNRKKY